jgi:cell division protein FtsN
MSLRYTGEATMDEPALRDVERWKDKIEVRLDNRQVFFLFFGSAMVACMLFVLGVIVGKRLESRGRAEAPAIEDPLAVLDRFGAVTTPSPMPSTLTFPRALIGGGPSKNRPSSPERTERADRADKVERIERLAAERITGKPTLTATAASPLPIPPSVASTGPTAAPAASQPALPAVSKKLAALPRPVASAPKSAPLARSAASLPATRQVAPPTKVGSSGSASRSLPAAPVAAASGASGASGEKSKVRFLLQLSSFQDRADADAFARRFAAQNAYVVATDIPGKGTWYRVRVGSYGNLQEASAAKTNFERDHNVIAYVAGGGPAR